MLSVLISGDTLWIQWEDPVNSCQFVASGLRDDEFIDVSTIVGECFAKLVF